MIVHGSINLCYIDIMIKSVSKIVLLCVASFSVAVVAIAQNAPDNEKILRDIHCRRHNS